MNEREVAIAEALRVVWCRHRETVIADLVELVQDLRTWNQDVQSVDLADRIRERSHRIRGSLTMVGRHEGADDLLAIETHESGPYAKEAVERIHGLLDLLRSVD